MNTIRQQLTALLGDELVFEAVVSSTTPYAGRFNWRRGDTADQLVEALGRARCLRQALAVATFATGALTVMRSMAWPAQARNLRHAAYCEGALAPSPRPSKIDQRHADAVRRWWE